MNDFYVKKYNINCSKDLGEAKIVVVVIVLTQVSVGNAESVQKKMESFDEIEFAHVVTGPYDVIAVGELDSKADFRRFVDRIHEVEGVVRTETCLGI
ncbi:MAG: Lrp/AsnC ligand binding domain-containing protein [Candidatus Thorarchaeota archaeon]